MSELLIDENTKAKDLHLITQEQRDAIAETTSGSYPEDKAFFVRGFWAALTLLSMPEDAETSDLTIKEFFDNSYLQAEKEMIELTLNRMLHELGR